MWYKYFLDHKYFELVSDFLQVQSEGLLLHKLVLFNILKKSRELGFYLEFRFEWNVSTHFPVILIYQKINNALYFLFLTCKKYLLPYSFFLNSEFTRHDMQLRRSPSPFGSSSTSFDKMKINCQIMFLLKKYSDKPKIYLLMVNFCSIWYSDAW